MLLLNHDTVADLRDNEGLTPMEMAEEGDYPEKDEVIEAMTRLATPSGNGDVSAPMTPRRPEGDDSDEEEKAMDAMSLPSLPHDSHKESPDAFSAMSGSRFLPRTPTRTLPVESCLGTRTTISKLVAQIESAKSELAEIQIKKESRDEFVKLMESKLVKMENNVTYANAETEEVTMALQNDIFDLTAAMKKRLILSQWI